MAKEVSESKLKGSLSLKEEKGGKKKKKATIFCKEKPVVPTTFAGLKSLFF